MQYLEKSGGVISLIHLQYWNSNFKCFRFFDEINLNRYLLHMENLRPELDCKISKIPTPFQSCHGHSTRINSISRISLATGIFAREKERERETGERDRGVGRLDLPVLVGALPCFLANCPRSLSQASNWIERGEGDSLRERERERERERKRRRERGIRLGSIAAKSCGHAPEGGLMPLDANCQAAAFSRQSQQGKEQNLEENMRPPKYWAVSKLGSVVFGSVSQAKKTHKFSLVITYVPALWDLALSIPYI